MSRRKRSDPDEQVAANEGTGATPATSSPYDQDAAVGRTPADDSFSQGYDAARRDLGAQSFHLRREILMCCVHGIRIPVKDGESPGAVALRVVELAEKIMLRAAECGLIDPPAQDAPKE
jgi:hypothetical protein